MTAIRKACLAAIIIPVAGCITIQSTSQYDEVIDNGLKEYKESINTLVKNLSDSAGKKNGMYEENKGKYNILESKIDLLIDRASIQSSGKGCKLPAKIATKVTKITEGKIPQETSNKEGGTSYDCTERLLILIKEQLIYLQAIHKNTDKCKPVEALQGKDSDPKLISCLRPASSETALKITNQSINAAWVVETAQKPK